MNADYRFVRVKTSKGYVSIARDCVESHDDSPSQRYVNVRMVSGTLHTLTKREFSRLMGAKKRVNQTNYLQVAFQTDEQKLKMYMKMPKKEIAQMLVNCNNVLSGMTDGAWQIISLPDSFSSDGSSVSHGSISSTEKET